MNAKYPKLFRIDEPFSLNEDQLATISHGRERVAWHDNKK